MMDHSESDFLNPIKDIAYLQKLMEKGYVLKGSRQNLSKDLYLKDLLEEDIILSQKIGWKAKIRFSIDGIVLSTWTINLPTDSIDRSKTRYKR